MPGKKKSPVIHLRRPPRWETRVLLFTNAGGRCEFDNCNGYLLEHHVTHHPGNFAEMAHIVAFSPSGPRGGSKLSADERNDLSNLMLLCPVCHKHIDDNPGLFAVDTLKAFKSDHEARIHMLTEAKADKQTSPLVLTGTIGSSPVAISVADMQTAVAPLYLDPREVFKIELTHSEEARTEAYWTSGCGAIRQRVLLFRELFAQSGRAHISVFALAPIPFLLYLGSCLSNKISTALFQRHRDTEDWKWKDEGDLVEYGSRVVRKGEDGAKVALLLSVSGEIPECDYARQIDGRFTVYEIYPSNSAPGFDHLRLRASLGAFRSRYRATLQAIVSEHQAVQEVLLFPAIPAPIAVAAGLDWMEKTHPGLVVYDKDGAAGFERAIVIRARA